MINLILRLTLVGAFALATLSPNISKDNEMNLLTPGVVTSLEKKSQGEVLSQEVTLVRDERVELLREFLEGYASPLVEEAETFIKVSDKYNLDWRFLPAITGVESTFGHQVAKNTFNPFGWGGGWVKFDSWSEAIETVGRELSARGERAGISTPEEWAPSYCPPNSKNWSRGVRYFMEELEKELLALIVLNSNLTASRWNGL